MKVVMIHTAESLGAAPQEDHPDWREICARERAACERDQAEWTGDADGLGAFRGLAWCLMWELEVGLLGFAFWVGAQAARWWL